MRRSGSLRAFVLTSALGTFGIAALGASPARAGGVDPGAATPVQREQAQARFARGRQLYDAAKYGPAADEFRASNDIVASPNARLYLARSLREQGKNVEAYVEFGRTAVEAGEHSKDDPRYNRAGAAARNERDALAPKIGFLLVHVQDAGPDTTMRIAGSEIRRAAWDEPAPVMPGASEVVVETPGREPAHETVTLTAGERKEITIQASSPATAEAPPATAPPATKSADRSSLRPYAYVAGGVGAVGLVTFAVAGLLSNGAYNDLSSSCPANRCPADKAGTISSGRTEQTIANVGLVIGAIGVAAGVALFVVSAPKKPEPSTGLLHEVVVTPAGVGGSF